MFISKPQQIKTNLSSIPLRICDYYNLYEFGLLSFEVRRFLFYRLCASSQITAETSKFTVLIDVMPEHKNPF